MAARGEERRREDAGWHRHQGGHHAGDSDEDYAAPVFQSNAFRINVMKVMRCSKKYCHDWTKCPFAHPGEKATRRDPSLGIYTGIACPDMKKDQRCPRGMYCPYAHNVFEYWLHPTRYRTALCRDVDRCTRKICFFAHDVSEIRTGVERPYVSPEQLLAAADAAAADPRVAAEYNAAAEEAARRSRPGLMTGLFNALDDSAAGGDAGAGDGSGEGPSLSLQAPRPTQENAEVMRALSSLIQGDGGLRWNPFPGGAGVGVGGGASGLGSRSSSLAAEGPLLSMPPSAQARLPNDRRNRVRRTNSEPLGRGPGPRRSAREAEAALQQPPPALPTLPTLPTQSVNTIDEMTPTMFPNYLDTLVRPGQLPAWALGPVNSSLLSGDQPSIWSTPVSPLDLYSTTSTSSDRQSLPDQSCAHSRLEAAYHQKLRKRLAQSRQEAALQGQGHGVNLLHSAPSPGLGPASQYAQALQQQQAMQAQAQAYLHSMQAQQAQVQAQQQAAYEQEMHARLQEAINAELRQQGYGQMGQPPPPPPPPQPVETGFDLRFGALGDNPGLLTQQHNELWEGRQDAARPSLLQSTADLWWQPPPLPPQQQQQQQQGESLQAQLARLDLQAGAAPQQQQPPPPPASLGA